MTPREQTADSRQQTAPDPDPEPKPQASSHEPVPRLETPEELVARLDDKIRRMERGMSQLTRQVHDAAMIRRLLDKRVEQQRKVNAGLHRSYEEAVGFIAKGRRLLARIFPLTKEGADSGLLVDLHCWMKDTPAALPSSELRTRLEELNRDAVGADGGVRRMIDPRDIARILTETHGVVE